MSVGDVKGYRRRLKVLAHMGHMPRKSGLSKDAMIERNRAKALNMTRANTKKT